MVPDQPLTTGVDSILELIRPSFLCMEPVRERTKVHSLNSRLGLRETPELPRPDDNRSVEPQKLAFQRVHPGLFPYPAELTTGKVDQEFARRLADDDREKVDSFRNTSLKQADFEAVLDEPLRHTKG